MNTILFSQAWQHMETEAGESQVREQAGQFSETWSLKRDKDVA